MSESAGGFTEFDSSEKKTDKVKLISIVINVVFLIIIIGLAVGIGVKARSKSVTVIPANPVSSEQLVPITGQYYSDAIRGAAEIQGKGDILDSKYFTMNDYYNMESSGSLHILPKFRTYQQTSDYTCGCACVLMAMDFVGKHDNSLTEAKCAELADIGTDIHQSAAGNDGAYPANLIKVLQMYNYEVESNNGTATYPFEDYATFRDWAINSIDNGWPIIVLSNDWAGHYTMIIGIDTMGTERTEDDVIIMADPYDTTDHRQDGYNVWGLERFFDLWGVEVTLLKNIVTTWQYIQVKSKK